MLWIYFCWIYLIHYFYYIVLNCNATYWISWKGLVYRWVGLFRRMKNNDIPYYRLHCKMVLLLLFVLCRCIDTFICFITLKSVDSDLLLYGFPVDY